MLLKSLSAAFASFAFSIFILAAALTPSEAQAAKPYMSGAPTGFEENRGQADAAVRFISRQLGFTLFLSDDETVFRLHGAHGSSVVRMSFAGGSDLARLRGIDRMPGVTNYLDSSPMARSITGIPSFAWVRAFRVVPGVNVEYHVHDGQLEYDLRVAPQVEVANLRLTFAGADQLFVDDRGNLVIDTANGRLVHLAPHALQHKGDRTIAVAVRYLLSEDGKVSFQLGPYDRGKELIIDPVLRFSTYLGGNDSLDPAGLPRLAFTRPVAIAIDGQANTYVAGYTDAMDFPTTNGNPISFFNGGCFLDGETIEPCDDFVAKFDSSGKMVYSTFLGDSNLLGLPFIRALTVDAKGQAYVAGFRALFTEFSPAFMKKLSADGSTVLYEYRIPTQCVINAVAVDAAGMTYIAGRADDPGGCPATPGAFQTSSTAASAFIAKLDSTQSGQFSQGETLIYLTFLGGSSDDEANAIKVDADGNAYVAGFTISSDFPRTSHFGSGTGGAFVSKLDATASTLIYSALLHGGMATALALDSARNAYITGSALGSGFPRTSGAFRTAFGGGDSDAFVAKLSQGGGNLRYSTYLGGSNEDHGTGIAVDGSGRVYVGGWTRSSDFPVSSNRVQKAFGGGTCNAKPCADAFVTTLDPSGTGLAFYSTLLGGSASEFENGLVIDKALNVYITGETYSSDFPATPGAFQTTKKGLSDGFISKLVIAGDLAMTMNASATSVPRDSNVTYTVRTLNDGPDQSDALVMTDTLPAGATFVSVSPFSGSCTSPPTGSGGTLRCTRTNLSKGSTWTVLLTLKLHNPSGSVITNVAKVKAKTQDLKISNNTVSTTVSIQR
jgi:uncharacterized repeat protein (TIGR01451 family)